MKTLSVFKTFLPSLNKPARAALTLSILALIASSSARATGGYDPCDDVACSSFFAPEIIDRPAETPFFRSGHIFYNGANQNSTDTIAGIAAVNASEWSNKLGGVVPPELLNQLLYKISPAQVQEVANLVAGSSTAASETTKAIAVELLRVPNRALVMSALKYLAFAKECEPLTTRMLADDAWSQPQNNSADGAEAGRLIGIGQARAAKEADAFLRDRYRLQVIRLMFYSGRYADAEKYYVANVSVLKTGGSAKQRFMNAAAGSFYKDKKYAMANYLFSLNFDQFAPLKKSSWFSFHPQEQADWNQSLALARSVRERNVLWQMFGISADGVAAIQNIYASQPQSDLLPLLLVREVNKAEEEIVANADRNRDGQDATTRGSDSAVQVVGLKRLATIQKIADRGNSYKPYLWNLATAHLYALTGHESATSVYLAKAQAGMPATEALQTQLRMTRLLARIASVRTVDKANQEWLGSELLWLKTVAGPRALNLSNFALSQLSDYYKKMGQPMVALMLKDDATSPIYTNNKALESIIALQNKSAKSNFEKLLVANYPYASSDLAEIRALNLLYAGQYVAAASILRTLPQTDGQKLWADPFTVHIVDCHDCDFAAPHKTYYKADFAQALAQLQVTAAGSGPDAATASFELANGLYNMSLYGNARAVYSTKWDNMEMGMGLKIASNKAAQKFYQRAIDLAPDAESKAKAAFMAAKTEKNEYFTEQRAKQNYDVDPSAPHSPKYFAMLKQKFSNTQYYKEIIRECGSFRKYLGQ